MTSDPIRGHTIRWTFDDGQMKGKSFEHTFDIDGTVAFRMLDGAAHKPAKAEDAKEGTEGKGGKDAKDLKAKPTKFKYEQASVSPDVHAVSYLSDSGYTLTCMLDFKTGNLVAFASNEKELVLQHGHFEVVRKAA